MYSGRVLERTAWTASDVTERAFSSIDFSYYLRITYINIEWYERCGGCSPAHT